MKKARRMVGFFCVDMIRGGNFLKMLYSRHGEISVCSRIKRHIFLKEKM